MPRGGHFASAEEPEHKAHDITAFFATWTGQSRRPDNLPPQSQDAPNIGSRTAPRTGLLTAASAPNGGDAHLAGTER